MGLKNFLKEFREFRESRAIGLEGATGLAIFTNSSEMTKEKALQISAVQGCVEMISNTVASIPICLYREIDNKVEEIKDDRRIYLLNEDTGDSLDVFQMKKALVEDYLLAGNGYIYINRNGNKVSSLHYVDEELVSVSKNTNRIFKDADFYVQGQIYEPYKFVKLLRKTKDGFKGQGLLKENSDLLSTAFNTMIFEKNLVTAGGNKKGVIKSQTKLTKESMDDLKKQWRNLYTNNRESCAILNAGLDFQELSNTAVEMQLNENKKTNTSQICALFNISENLLKGNSTTEEYRNFIKLAILPILNAIETALNKELLLNSEQGSFYFAFNTKELLKADIKERFEAYEIASKNGFMQTDEIRYEENLEPLGFNYIKLGLQDVLYDIETDRIYTPNTGRLENIKTSKEV